jgi:uncharacterized ferredoxin-like protein
MMKGVDLVAELMAVSAATAPKSGGKSFVQIKILKGGILKKLGKAMVSFGEKAKKKDFDRDGKNVGNSDAVVLIGLEKAQPIGLNCGACGFSNCKELLKQKSVEVEFKGPTCAYRLLDMGIALGSAVKTASLLNVDNRIMYRIGAVARDMKLVDWDYVMGIPLSVTGKSIYFDR